MDPASLLSARLPRAGLVALYRARLNKTFGARVGWAATLLVVAVALAIAASAGARDGDAPLAPLITGAMEWVLWVGAGPLLLAMANARAQNDRAEGIDTLARVRGARTHDLVLARMLAGVSQLAVMLLLPSVVLCGLLALLVARAELLYGGLALGVFALWAALVLGGVAALCGQYAGSRGRWLLLAIVVLPWALGDAWSVPAISLPGLLSASLSLAGDAAVALVGALP